MVKRYVWKRAPGDLEHGGHSAVVFVALTLAFAFAVSRYVATTKEQDPCPACVDERRQTR